MKKIVLITLLVASNVIFAQKNEWIDFSKEKTERLKIDKTGIYKVQNYTFDVIWDEKLDYSNNIGYYGGIKKMTIYKDNKQIQVLNDIEDTIALGEINFCFYDYNFDGELDFTIPINYKWLRYYLFIPKSNKFENLKDWDYLKIQKVDKKNKRILTHPDGNATVDNRKTYKIKGLDIIKI
ncbi:XAC2610-related protein [Lacinutrix undariae]